MNHERSSLLWYDPKTSELSDVTTAVAASAALSTHKTSESPTVFVHRERLIKSPAEIELMRRTCHIAAGAINRTMQETRPDDTEHQIFARVDYHSRMDGASYLAYPPVVAGGTNAITIHYINNSQVVRDGQMVLMDAGTSRFIDSLLVVQHQLTSSQFICRLKLDDFQTNTHRNSFRPPNTIQMELDFFF